MKQYLELVEEVLDRGTRKQNRTGVDTISAFNVNYAIDLQQGFPLLTTKEISWKNIVVENLWFLSGDRHIGLLQKHGCKFWDPWADAEGFVPSAYGNFWRHFPVHAEGGAGFNDQVRYVLRTLRENPASRRMVVSAWAPGNAQASQLPPCHLMFIFNVQYDADGEPHLCLHLTQRSCDVALGVPYNIAGYAFLLSLFAHLAGMRAGTFGHSLVDAHIYTAKPDGSMGEYDHVPGLREQLQREPRQLPRLAISPDLKTLDDVLALCDSDLDDILAAFRLDGYDPQPAISFKVAV
ncbi:MAG: thymidylate synthase [Euryarchaeota archaeon]|nr:thymidylate synthase [Euryarchaeota archaeon]MDP6363535.1 thymidylate synthase [Candidatus Poseidoniia archaeon]MDP6658565.1 thymidylate synthase [Candidatus Poseidoniia archaeon]MDP7007096.1 thymidylate synthase [Candidatus Poseidoniia archaeon]